jgi:hypothetical protein
MKHPLKICCLLLCIMFISTAFANPYSRGDNDNSRPVIEIINNQPTPYRPALRQAVVLFVEDKCGTFGPPTQPDPVWDSVLTEILGAGNYGWYGPTQSAGDDGPPLDTMLQYELVIWNTYDYWWTDTAALTENDQTNVGDYLTVGGKVWLIGQDALWSGIPMLWMDTYFHLLDANQDYNAYDSIINLDGLAEISGWSITAIADYASNDWFTDELIPDTLVGCHAVLEDVDSLRTVGIFYPGWGEWKSAFWSIDGRVQPDSSDWSEWVAIVTGMFEAFEVLGIAEIPSQKLVQKLQLNITPAPIVTSTTISYYLPTGADVKLQIFNNTGQHMITLVDDYKYAGSYKVIWNGKDARAANVPNGVYFARLSCGELSVTGNLVVIK